MAIPLPVTLRLSAAIRNEWRVRCIADVIPALEGACWDVPRFATDYATLEAIRKDCAFMASPECVDAYPAERAAYRALLKQCEALQGA